MKKLLLASIVVLAAVAFAQGTGTTGTGTTAPAPGQPRNDGADTKKPTNPNTPGPKDTVQPPDVVPGTTPPTGRGGGAGGAGGSGGGRR